MSKRVTPNTSRRSQSPEKIMREYFDKLIVYELNEFARIYGPDMVYRARSKSNTLPLIPCSVWDGTNTKIRDTYWYPTAPMTLVRTLVRVNGILLQSMIIGAAVEIHQDDVPTPRDSRLYEPDCAYPNELIYNVNQRVQIDRRWAESFATIMENITKSMVEFVVATMIANRHYPMISPSLCCKLIYMPDIVISCAQEVENNPPKKKSTSRAAQSEAQSDAPSAAQSAAQSDAQSEAQSAAPSAAQSAAQSEEQSEGPSEAQEDDTDQEYVEDAVKPDEEYSSD